MATLVLFVMSYPQNLKGIDANVSGLVGFAHLEDAPLLVVSVSMKAIPVLRHPGSNFIRCVPTVEHFEPLLPVWYGGAEVRTEVRPSSASPENFGYVTIVIST
ncbi:hypothetical protein E2C01_035284 [Portunus trituberculatus]|uniref:Uncharacterized protein n=1 Tax=Portunus trituberculatus TaxID=210409 RepID=A0A5B7FB25_PORTR|nr:hypothetical protein [Portunus trituberculatus]